MTRRRHLRVSLVLLAASCATREPSREEAPSAITAPPAPPPAASIAPSSPPAAIAPSASIAAIAPSASTAASAAALPDVAGMALVPAGSFSMGADHGGEPDEHPAHAVTLAAFYLDLTEVTNEAYDRCVVAKVCTPPDPRSAEQNKLGSDTRFRGPRQPVSSVSWESARGYCAWLGKRLPTEAEWEKAARGTDGRRFPWGDAPPTPDRAVFSTGTTGDVGTHAAGDGPYGHHDLAGNVWEWVEDVYDPYAYGRPESARGRGGTCEEALAALADLRSHGKQGFTGSNPLPTECERVLRGGAFNYPPDGLRSTNRVHHPARYHLVMSGFRCAKDAPVRQ